jgi:methyl-accepting chemotaxis protein
MYENMTVPAMELAELSTSFQKIRVATRDIMLSHSPEAIRQQQEAITASLGDIDGVAGEFESRILSDEMREMFGRYRSAHTSYSELLTRYVELAGKQSRLGAQELLNGPMKAAADEESASLQSMLETKIGQACNLQNDNYEKGTSTVRLMLAVSGGGLLLLGLLSYFIARFISSPLKKLAAEAKLIAAGDLTIHLEQFSSDEVGELTGSFSNMVRNLHDTIGKVIEASVAVASASSEISSSTQQLAAGAEEQSGQTTEVAGAIEEMTKSIIENSQTAGSTASAAARAKLAAENGGKAVVDMVTGMVRIVDVVRNSSATVKTLGHSSEQIGEIVDVIDDIADQTNLLALNAAIEAARAGEQGRGFAVVADEVRKLAERTTKATKEIAAMIKTIQNDTQGAVASMDEGTTEVEQGLTLAEHAGETLAEIVGLSQNVSDMVAQIANANEQQSRTSEQIAKNVEAISSVAGESATGAQQIARASEDLNRLTETLRELVSHFILNSDAGGEHDGEKVGLRNETGQLNSMVAVSEQGALVSK